MKVRHMVRGGGSPCGQPRASLGAGIGLIGGTSLTSGELASGSGTSLISPEIQRCQAGAYYYDEGNSRVFVGRGEILFIENDTPYQTTESFAFDVSIGMTETVNNESAYDLGISDFVNAGISATSGHSVSKSRSDSGTVTVSVPTPAGETAHAQAGFKTIDSHGYVYGETDNCDTTDVYNVSSTSAPYGHGARVWD